MDKKNTFFVRMILEETSVDKLNKLIEAFKKGNVRENPEKYDLLVKLATLKIFCIDRLIDPEISNKCLQEFYNRAGKENESDIKKKILIIEKINIYADSKNLSLRKVEELVLEHYDDNSYLEQLLNKIKHTNPVSIKASTNQPINQQKLSSFLPKEDNQHDTVNKTSSDISLEINSKQKSILYEYAKNERGIEKFVEDPTSKISDADYDSRTFEIEQELLEEIRRKANNSLRPKSVIDEEFKRMAFELYAKYIYVKGKTAADFDKEFQRIILNITEEEGNTIELAISESESEITRGNTNATEIIKRLLASGKEDNDNDDMDKD